MKFSILPAVLAVFLSGLTTFHLRLAAAESTPTTTNNAAIPRSDANGNPIRRAPTGHISNYDESKVGSYTLPDPLRLQGGQPVRDAKMWLKQRRPEILKLYETEIYGSVPKGAPKLTFKAVAVDTNALDGAAVR